KRFSRISPIISVHERLEAARTDLAAARELAAEDPAFSREAEELAERVESLDATLTDMLAPRDEHDAEDIVMEVKSGAGGEESALFAADLVRMYLRYAEREGWKAEVLGASESDLGGFKEVSVSIKSRGDGPDGVW